MVNIESNIKTRTEERKYTDNNGCDTLEHEDPRPSKPITDTAHETNPVGERSTKCSSAARSAEEESNSPLQHMTRIPERKAEQGQKESRKKRLTY